MPGSSKPRDYDASSRKKQSAATRQRIIDAAGGLLVTRSYRAATIASIARKAGVHVDTVYELVGRKPQLLRELIEQALSGVDRAIPGERRDHVQAMLATPDAVEKLRIYAAAIRQTHARLSPLFLALRDASSTEPEAREVWHEISERRSLNMHKLIADLRTTGQLRPELSIDMAADVMWATNSPELYVMLTKERGWSPELYETWILDSWCRLLLTTV